MVILPGDILGYLSSGVGEKVSVSDRRPCVVHMVAQFLTLALELAGALG